MAAFVDAVFRIHSMYNITRRAALRYLSNILRRKGQAALVIAIALAIAAYLRNRRVHPLASRRIRTASIPSDNAIVAAGSTAAKKKTELSDAAQLKKILHVLLPSLASSAGKHIIALGLLSVLRTAVNDRVSRIQGNLFRAVFLRESPLFVRLILENMAANFISSGLQATLTYITRRLALLWQKKLTDKIARSYFSSLTYYRLAFVDKRVSDPEQIFTNDIPALVDGLSEVAVDALRCFSDGVYFTHRVFSEVGAFSLCSLYIN